MSKFQSENVTVEKFLGSGNFGEVHLCSVKNNITNAKRLYAQKKFKVKSRSEAPSQEKIEIEKQKFLIEMRVTVYLSNSKNSKILGFEHIVQAKGFDYVNHLLYLEFCDSGSLDNIIAEKFKKVISRR